MNGAAQRLVLLADLAGTFLFAVQGGLAGARGGLDLMGVLVLAFVTAVGGGMIRDVLIGAVPPAALRDWRYPVIAFAGGVLAFLAHPLLGSVPIMLLMALDAGALALFAVSGAEKALAFGIQPFIAVLLGAITGVGGGAIRDVLLNQVPAVLRTDIYATAALLGGAILVGARHFRLSPALAAILGGIACFLLRVLAVIFGWHLPMA